MQKFFVCSDSTLGVSAHAKIPLSSHKLCSVFSHQQCGKASQTKLTSLLKSLSALRCIRVIAFQKLIKKWITINTDKFFSTNKVQDVNIHIRIQSVCEFRTIMPLKIWLDEWHLEQLYSSMTFLLYYIILYYIYWFCNNVPICYTTGS